MTVPGTEGLLAKLLDFFPERYPHVKVRVHVGYQQGAPEANYHVVVVNRSPKRPVKVIAVWFATKPDEVPVWPESPQYELAPGARCERWIPAARIPGNPSPRKAARKARVLLEHRRRAIRGRQWEPPPAGVPQPCGSPMTRD